jgi:hypothetical protein
MATMPERSINNLATRGMVMESKGREKQLAPLPRLPHPQSRLGQRGFISHRLGWNFPP